MFKSNRPISEWHDPPPQCTLSPQCSASNLSGTPSLTQTQHNFCLSTLRNLKRSNDARPFLYLINIMDTNIPHYPEIISHPVDFSIIEGKLKSLTPTKFEPGKAARPDCRPVYHEHGMYSWLSRIGPSSALNIPSYPKIIKWPTDFSTMRNKLDNHEYPNAQAFFADFKLMIRNCFQFNTADTPINLAGIELQRLFDNEWKNLPNPSCALLMVIIWLPRVTAARMTNIAVRPLFPLAP